MNPHFPPPPQHPQTVREWDRRAIDDFGLPGDVLMESAGAAAAREILSRPNQFAAPFHILCGPGNNGGDGYVVARYLHNAGHDVRLKLAFDPAASLRDDQDATVFFRVAQAMGIPISIQTEPSLGKAGTVIDALLGTGLSRPLRSPYLEWVRAVETSGLPVVALDLPSGLDAATGKVLGAAIRADLTLTFAAAKIGFASRSGPAQVGEVIVLDIGLPAELWINPR